MTISPTPPPRQLQPPSHLTATVISANQINLSWYDNSTGETGFTIHRVDTLDKMVTIIKVPSSTTSFQDKTVMPNKSYSYNVYATNSNCDPISSEGTCDSYPSEEITARTPTVSVPATPSSLSATAISHRQINLSWKDNATNETGYCIERALSGGSFITVGTTVKNSTSFNDLSALAYGKTYQYRICAVNGGGSSAYSSTVSATTYSNIGQGKTASASSTYSSSYAASKAVDGLTTTMWSASSTSVPQWLKVDLGSSRTLTGTQVMWEKSGVIYKYTIQTSSDNSTWTTRANLSANTNTAQTQSQNFSATARYVRIYISAVPSGSRARIYEFRVFGK